MPRGRHQPPTRPSHGQLRPALESATAWNSASDVSTASVRQRSAICGTSSPRKRVRGMSLPGLLEKLEVERAARWVGRSSMSWARSFQGTPTAPIADRCDPLWRSPRGAGDGSRSRWTSALNPERLRALIADHALAHDTMDTRRVLRIREAMERAEARRLQPHFIASLFPGGLPAVGRHVREREPRRYEVTHVPAAVRSRDRLIGRREPCCPAMSVSPSRRN